MAMFLAQSRMHESDDTDIEIVAVIDYSSLRILNRRRRAVEHFLKTATHRHLNLTDQEWTGTNPGAETRSDELYSARGSD